MAPATVDFGGAGHRRQAFCLFQREGSQQRPAGLDQTLVCRDPGWWGRTTGPRAPGGPGRSGPPARGGEIAGGLHRCPRRSATGSPSGLEGEGTSSWIGRRTVASLGPALIPNPRRRSRAPQRGAGSKRRAGIWTGQRLGGAMASAIAPRRFRVACQKANGQHDRRGCVDSRDHPWRGPQSRACNLAILCSDVLPVGQCCSLAPVHWKWKDQLASQNNPGADEKQPLPRLILPTKLSSRQRQEH